MNKKKILLLVNNIQGLIDTLKLELEEEEVREPSKNSITIDDLIKRMNSETVCEQFDAIEEDCDGPDILIGSKEEREFYERFNLGE